MKSCRIYLEKNSQALLIIDEKKNIIFYNIAAAKLLLSAQNFSVERIFPVGNCVLVYLAFAAQEDFSLTIHQLRSPLVAIKWTTESLLEEVDCQKNQLEDILRSNKYLIDTINETLEIAKIESGKNQVKCAKGDLISAVNETVRMCVSLAEHKKQKIIFKTLVKSAPAIFDPNLIRIILQSFIDNAIYYGDENSEITIFLSHEESKNKFVIRVNNKGLFISEEERSNIGRKFYRSDAAKKIKPFGSGLGLFMAKKAIEANGGEFWFDSNENSGTTFYFSVPMAVGFSVL